MTGVGGLLLVSSVAHAQVAGSFRDLQGSLAEGARLAITEQSGVTKGRFVDLTGQSLRVTADSTRRQVEFSEASVMEIDHVRSRKGKGALTGFVSSFVGGLLLVAMSSDSPSIGPSKRAVMLPLAGIFGGMGAGVGAVIGAMSPSHDLIYLAPGRTAPVP
jgi:hypothetical protein